MHIVVDDREQAGGLPDALERLLRRPPDLRRLELGDVIVDGRLIIERKTLADLTASIADGRLGRQCSRLAAAARSGCPCLILIEGEEEDARTSFAFDAIRAAILSLQLDWRLPVIQTNDVRDTAGWIVAAARAISDGRAAIATGYRPEAEKPAPPPLRRRRPPRSADPRDVQLAVLCRCPGLGQARARALLDIFGSLQAVRTATPHDWMKVPGIGPDLAASLRKFLAGLR